MKSVLDSQTIDISCPSCGHKLRQSIGRLKLNPQLICRCGQVINVNESNMSREIAKVDKGLADLGKALGRLGKRR